MKIIPAAVVAAVLGFVAGTYYVQHDVEAATASNLGLGKNTCDILSV